MTTGTAPWGRCVLPALGPGLDSLWDTVLDLAEDLGADGWVLVGGQMVLLHGLVAGRVATRASKGIDLLADLVASGGAVGACVRVVLRLGFEPLTASDPRLLHRFVRPADQAVVDVLAPDHAPPSRRPTTIPPRSTIVIDGGRQALERATLVEVTKGDRTVGVPVPSPLGALVLKGAAYRADSRERERHAYDAAFLVSLVTDPITTRESLKGSDRKRLRALNEVLADPAHEAWALLGEAGEDALIRWRLLLA